MVAKIIKWVFLGFVFLTLQTTILHNIAISNVTPDLLMIMLFFIAVKYGSLAGIYVGFLIGLGQDVYSPEMIGQNALVKAVAGCIAGFFNEKMIRLTFVMRYGVFILFFLVHDALYTGVGVFTTGQEFLAVPGRLLVYTLPRCLYSLVIAMIFQAWEEIIRPSLGSR
jgi:rod shape-determining protein MreD